MSISARAQERAGRQRWLNTKLASAAAAADAEEDAEFFLFGRKVGEKASSVCEDKVVFLSLSFSL